MNLKPETKVQEMNRVQNFTTIPKSVVEDLQLEKGDKITWCTNDGVAFLKKKVNEINK